jgi:amidase
MKPKERHFVPKEQYTFALEANLPPVLQVTPPCIVTFECDDRAWVQLAQGEAAEEIGFNPVTGPVFVHGAEPGDALQIEVLEVEVTKAWSAWFPGLGLWGAKTERIHVRQIPLEGEWAIIRKHLKVPLEPMIGCIGVAPASGSSSTIMPAYPWGGNLDLRELGPGGTVYLPVQVPGALLSVGDLHAAMGAGEPTAVSLEAAGQATVRITVEKNTSLQVPRVRTGNDTIFVGIADDYDQARQLAMDQAYEFLTEEVGLSPTDAYAYASARVSVRFGGPASQIVLAVVPHLDT